MSLAAVKSESAGLAALGWSSSRGVTRASTYAPTMEPYSLHADIPRVITALLHAYAVFPIINTHLQVNKEKWTVSSHCGTLWSHGIFPGRGFTAEIGALVKDPNAFHMSMSA